MSSLLRTFPAFLLLAACATIQVTGTYVGGLAATKDAPEREVRITLKPDSAASVQAVFLDRPARLFAEGTWQEVQGHIVIQLANGQTRLVFKRFGTQLVAREWDRAFWGEGGPGVLYRR